MPNYNEFESSVIAFVEDADFKLNLLRDICISQEEKIIKLQEQNKDLSEKVEMLVDLQKILEM